MSISEDYWQNPTKPAAAVNKRPQPWSFDADIDVLCESVVLCEGFDDRAFWSGWFRHLEFESLKPERGRPVFDPWGKQVSGGVYAYRSKTGHFVRLIPVYGKVELISVANKLLLESVTRPLKQLVLNRDSDLEFADMSTSEPTIGSYLAGLLPTGASAEILSDNEVVLRPGGVRISLALWKSMDAAAPGIPTQQTLERLVCSSLRAAYRDRSACVSKWLNSRGAGLSKGPKEHAWSYMAGWYADLGCDEFYQAMWREEKMVAELTKRLKAIGAWDIAIALSS